MRETCRQIGVPDLDSPLLDRFGEMDHARLEKTVRLLAAATDWPDFLGDARPL